MLYEFDITVPANTPQSEPTRLECRLTSGVIRHVEVAFPPGPCALVHISLWRFEHQVYPTNPDDDFCWEDHTIAFDDEFELDSWPYTMIIKGWSEAEDYPHTITIRLELGEKVYTLADLLAQRTPVSILEE